MRASSGAVVKLYLGVLCSVWKVMNNMIIVQHTKINASFETSTHVVEHIFKVILHKRLRQLCHPRDEHP